MHCCALLLPDAQDSFHLQLLSAPSAPSKAAVDTQQLRPARTILVEAGGQVIVLVHHVSVHFLAALHITAVCSMVFLQAQAR